MAAGKPFSIFLLLFATHSVVAQTDSSQTRLREVEVTANRSKTFSVGSRSTRASELQLQLKKQATLSELLRQISPAYIKNYGSGNLATLSVRGTTANQSALVWNGIQFNAPTNGLADLSLIQTGSVQAVQLVYGPMSALYGTGAVGGTLLLDSKPVAPGEYFLSLDQVVGSFSSYQTRVAGTYGCLKWQGRTSYSYSAARNDFPFRNTFEASHPLQRTVNARFYQYNFTQDLYFFPSARYSVALHAWHHNTHRQIPPVLSVPFSQAEQHDRSLRLAAVIKRNSSLGTTTLRSGYLSDYLLYLNPRIYSVPPGPARTATWLTEAEQQVVFKKTTLNAGMSVRHITGRVAEYGRNVAQNQHALLFSVRQQLASKTIVALNTRKEFVEGYDPDPTVSVGVELQLTRQSGLLAKAQVANSFRVPTLNERYWKPGGNPNLNPEKGVSAEAGIQWKPEKQEGIIKSAELTGYTSRVTDMIVWQQVGGVVFSPINLNRVWARGVEASLEVAKNLLPTDKLNTSLRTAYSYTRSTQQQSEVEIFKGKQLIYVPMHTATLFATLESAWVSLGVQQAWHSSVYTSADNNQELSGYFLTELMVWTPQVKVNRLDMQLQGTIRNALNQTYQAIKNIPMPGRSYELRVQLLIPFSKETQTN